MNVPYALQTRRLAESQRYLLEESDSATLSNALMVLKAVNHAANSGGLQ